MALVDELISETESLLQSLRAVKHDIESSSRQRAAPSTLPSRPASTASRPPGMDGALQNCRIVLSRIISNAQALLGQLPSNDSAAGRADAQPQITDSSTCASTNASEQPRPNAEYITKPPSGNTLTIPPLPNPSSPVHSPTPSVLSSANSELLREVEEDADRPQNNPSEVGQSGGHHKEQHGTGVNAEPEDIQDAGAEGALDRYGKEVYVVDFGAEQMGAALVAQLEKLAAATPSQCYDKIRIIDFASPDFSQAQTPASGYMRGSIYSKDGFKVTALTAEADFTFPSADTLSQEHSRLSLEEVRSFFQAVFDNPPSEALPYFVGPIPMPSEYVPLVDAGPRLQRRNNGNIPGVNTPFWYISQCDRTPATLHIEDGNLGSVNLLLAGAPKIWLFIPKCEKTNIESRMKELYGPWRVPCSQGIRHYNAIISPGLLEEWGITYYLDCCLPGEMIVTRQDTYHQVLNMGPNIAESVNIEFSDAPDMPAGYVWCKRGRGPAACGPHVITASSFGSSHAKATGKKRTRSTPAPITKKAKGMKPSSALSNPKGIAYGRFTGAQQHNIVTKLGSQADNSTIELLTCLLFAIGSPEAICQLRHACRMRQTSHIFPKGETIGEATKALDTIEDVTSSYAIIRRYHLLSLAKHRESLFQLHKLRTRTRNSGTKNIQKVETLVLEDLYNEAYSNKHPPKTQQTKLKNWLRHGHNWASLEQKFSIGVLALLPTGRNTALQNSQIERVNQQVFVAFLDILQQERGEFIQQMAAAVDNIYTDILFNEDPMQHYYFEKMDLDVLCNTSFDDKSLLGYCAKV